MDDQNPPSVDGISPQTPSEPDAQQLAASEPVAAPPPPPPPLDPTDQLTPEQRKRARTMLAVVFGVPYALFLLWCLILMSILPSASGEFDSLIYPGVMSAAVGVIALLIVGGFALNRTFQRKGVTSAQRYLSLARIVGVLTPGILLGGLIPLMITAEPPLGMQVTDPIDPEAYVAPLAVTFDLRSAVSILERRGLRAISYGWDFDGDGQKNEDTVTPEATAVYDRAGLYNVVARIQVSDGTFRRIVYRLFIPKEVFSVAPIQPIVDEPVTFSVSHLVDLPEELREVQWDFDADGVADEVTTELDIVHTYVRTGPQTVSAVVNYENQTQLRYEKIITISEAPPLPFDVSIRSQPDFLFSPPPFGTAFEVITDEPLQKIEWDYGDGDTEEGERVKHTFREVGDYVVTLRARSSETGDIAKLTKVVRVTPKLTLPDLTFTGSPDVDVNQRRIVGEIPLKLNITPRTSQRLVEFFWEAPEATAVGSTDTTLQAIYRRADTYIITLVAQDTEGRVMRMPITVEVLPPSSNISIRMTPEGGVAPLEVQFDASETTIPGEDISGFEWLFGDDPEALPTQGGAALTHTYIKPGTYTVTLYARTTRGNIYEASKTIVVRAPLLDACFTASRLSGRAPLGVKFNMSCTSGIPVQITWDFNDGTTTDERNPVHVFEDPGRFKVTLKLKDEVGSISTQTIDINVQ